MSEYDFLSLENVKDFFDNLDHEQAVQGLTVMRPYLLTVISADQLEALIKAVDDASFDEFVKVMHQADEQGITVFASIDFNDAEEEIYNQLPSADTESLIEVMRCYEALEDNNYSGSELNNIAFVSSEHFESYIRDTEIDAGNIASHLEKYIDWEDFADDVRRSDYGSVEIDAPNLLGGASIEYFYRK